MLRCKYHAIKRVAESNTLKIKRRSLMFLNMQDVWLYDLVLATTIWTDYQKFEDDYLQSWRLIV